MGAFKIRKQNTVFCHIINKLLKGLCPFEKKKPLLTLIWNKNTLSNSIYNFEEENPIVCTFILVTFLFQSCFNNQHAKIKINLNKSLLNKTNCVSNLIQSKIEMQLRKIIKNHFGK